jgi:hypothetical protein
LQPIIDEEAAAGAAASVTSLTTFDPLIALTRRNCAAIRMFAVKVLDCLPRGNLTALESSGAFIKFKSKTTLFAQNSKGFNYQEKWIII